MAFNKDQAATELKLLQYDYADGHGSRGPVLGEFSKVLTRYHENYCKWQPYTDPGYHEKLGLSDNLPELLITAGAVFAVYLLLFVLFHVGTVLQVIYYVAAAIAIGYESDNIGYGILFGTLDGILSFVTGDSQIYVVAGTLILFLLFELSNKWKNYKKGKKIDRQRAKDKRAHDDLEYSLYSDRETLIRMTPDLRREYAAYREQIFRSNPGVFTEDERRYLCAELPELFWWEISPQQLAEMEAMIGGADDDDGIAWETRWVRRDERSVFQYAGEEFSALCIGEEDPAAEARRYDRYMNSFLSNGGMVVDFIARGTTSRMEAETIKYKDYKYSDSTRSDVNFLTLMTAIKIDKDYKEGRVSEEQYAKNIGAFGAMMAYADEKMNEQVVKERVEYHQIKSHTNIWTGQMLIGNDNTNPGGLAIVDYRCQIYHTFRNLDSLHDVLVTRVLGSVMYRDPAVLAKIHRICPTCR